MKPTTYQGNFNFIHIMYTNAHHLPSWQYGLSEWVSEWEWVSEFNAMSANEAIFTGRVVDFYRIINNIL